MERKNVMIQILDAINGVYNDASDREKREVKNKVQVKTSNLLFENGWVEIISTLNDAVDGDDALP